MTAHVRFKNEKFKELQGVIAFFFKDDKILFRFANRDLKYSLKEVYHFEVYDYD